jgi:protein involved in polysaccharide export with SLBB domain
MKNKYKYIVYYLLIVLFDFSYSQSAQDLQKMKSEYDKMKKDDVSYELENKASINEVDQDIPVEAKIYPYIPDQTVNYYSDTLKHFGYDFFMLRDSLSFWENLPTPSNYLLGAGDEIIITIWGQTQHRKSYRINRQGNVYDDKVGLLYLSGLNINEAKTYLKSQFSRIYSTLSGLNSTSFIDVSIGSLRSINVNFVGKVKYPGVYPVHPFSTVILGLIQAGGVDIDGSLRNIQVKRDNEIVKKVDLYDYFINGASSSAIQLRDQDVIVVPSRNSIVTVDSAVLQPGIFESIPGETMYDIIQYAGGPTFDASNIVGYKRLKNKDQDNIYNYYEAGYLDYNSTRSITVNSGDKLNILRIYDEDHEVEIIGQVKSPGKYYYYDGMTLNNLLELSGGFKDSTFLKSVYLDKAEIIRRDPNNRFEKIITVNLKNIISKDKNINLENLDRILIRSNFNFFKKENVIVSGEVKVPGVYPLITDNESLESVLKRAGGLTSKALQNGISIYRKKTESVDQQKLYSLDEQKVKNDKTMVAWKDKKIVIMPGDSLVVQRRTATIFITGEVYNPGILEFVKGKSLRYYLNAAGGLTELGNKNGIILLYPNGLVKPKKWYSSPKVEDGSTIIISQKTPETPFNMTQFATNWTSIISSLITAYLLTRQL